MKQKKQKRILYISAILMSVICISIPTYILLKNMSWMNGAFLMFGAMFATGYYLLTLTLKRMRKRVGVNG